jgi:internalin A
LASDGLQALRELQLVSQDGTLDLSNQGLTALPPQIGQLTSLKVLRLEENRLTALPPELADLVIGDLQLEHAGNPLRESFPKLIGQDKQVLATYLRSLEDAVPQYEAKVLLVGEGNVGKTSSSAHACESVSVSGR